jgi:DnaJ-class molecular chaperone
LSDQDKRAEYDQFGTINSNPNQDHHGRGNGGFHDNPFRTFEEFFANSHHFHFGGGNGGGSRKSPEEAINKRSATLGSSISWLTLKF